MTNIRVLHHTLPPCDRKHLWLNCKERVEDDSWLCVRNQILVLRRQRNFDRPMDNEKSNATVFPYCRLWYHFWEYEAHLKPNRCARRSLIWGSMKLKWFWEENFLNIFGDQIEKCDMNWLHTRIEVGSYWDTYSDIMHNTTIKEW